MDTAKSLPFSIPVNRWSVEEARGKTPSELLLYRSNLLGSDLTVTNFGGGNTSARIEEQDPLTGAPTQVLYTKLPITPGVIRKYNESRHWVDHAFGAAR